MASDPEAHGADRGPTPGGTSESRRSTLGRSEEGGGGGGSGRQARVQIHTAEGNHHSAEEAAEGAARANCAADGEAEHKGLGGGHGADGTARADLAAGRLQTREWRRGAGRGRVGSLEAGTNERHPSRTHLKAN